MVFISKIKKVARKVNTVALTGAVLIGGMGLMSFVGEKEVVDTDARKTIQVTRGVEEADLDEGILYLTTSNVPASGTIGCGISTQYPCKVTLEENDILFDGAGRPYVEIGSGYTQSGSGPYIAPQN